MHNYVFFLMPGALQANKITQRAPALNKWLTEDRLWRTNIYIQTLRMNWPITTFMFQLCLTVDKSNDSNEHRELLWCNVYILHDPSWGRTLMLSNASIHRETQSLSHLLTHTIGRAEGKCVCRPLICSCWMVEIESLQQPSTNHFVLSSLRGNRLKQPF